MIIIPVNVTALTSESITVSTTLESGPVNNIIPTISESGSYGKWMNNLLEIYDGIIFARKFWKGVAFSLD